MKDVCLCVYIYIYMFCTATRGQSRTDADDTHSPVFRFTLHCRYLLNYSMVSVLINLHMMNVCEINPLNVVIHWLLYYNKRFYFKVKK